MSACVVLCVNVCSQSTIEKLWWALLVYHDFDLWGEVLTMCLPSRLTRLSFCLFKKSETLTRRRLLPIFCTLS